MNSERTEDEDEEEEAVDRPVDDGEKPVGVSVERSGLTVRGLRVRERGEGGEVGEKVKEEGELRCWVGEVLCEEEVSKRVMDWAMGPSEAGLPVLKRLRIGSAVGIQDGVWPMLAVDREEDQRRKNTRREKKSTVGEGTG